jgi:hypothetical protein
MTAVSTNIVHPQGGSNVLTEDQIKMLLDITNM